MMSNTPSPNFPTSFFASTGPIPLIIPLPRYFSIPSREFGALARRLSARNWSPCWESRVQLPSALIHSPPLTVGRLPSTVTRSRWPRTFTRSTAKPFSSLKNVTRSTNPSICSVFIVDERRSARSSLPLRGGLPSGWRPPDGMILRRSRLTPVTLLNHL